MYNVTKPTLDDLPTSKQLLRSTLIALVAAFAILIAIVLPSEYGIDPTGIGRVLGLSEMGEIKTQLAEEAAADAARDAALAAEQSAPALAPTTGAATSPAQPVEDATWRDEMRVVLQPGQGAEVKLSMKTGEQAQFSWVAEGGVVNFDTHGDGGGQSISYEKGRAVPADDGVLEAAFDGNHGWFWRNRDSADVTVIIRTRGQYTEMKRVL
ncbi:transmembrane anchor protein [Pseudomonas aeruginosa]|uniref:transmembrane anchor protein n=1 Tax=Gammaproteobacteria TaxID=1236 RepID=UPI0012493769|nr:MULTISPECIES: transmembrane anchor protein [Gammaproteobacteria]KAB0699541.1 transmembrane anchor protein [Pseudomonas aeruginosa]MBG4443731.1 transmembrane anchor protein [Pseudomonas aeruginosa]MBH4069624.1 transmembrane anchor protein [Pseudomonas aeruginosa]MCE7522895.1 transmembrane anchor protein [Alloalcanivorax xenomutans]HEP8071121.1 transmembrane anchor protein [Pseudomonas aeruginosa]